MTASTRSLRLGAFVALALLVGGVGVACTDDDDAPADSSATAVQQSADAGDSATRTTSNTTVQTVTDLADIVEQVTPSVVLIESVGNGLGVSGSGVVIDQEGHVLTNYHVVQGQTSLKVTLHDGSASLANVVGTDPANDLAVIQATDFESSVLHPVTFGDSDKVRPGQPVFAIGNPFTQNFTVTSGIISAINRSSTSAFTQRPIQDVLQTDAALNPGNSGGPLFNLDGEVIGINTSIENPEGRVFAGIGFAVPSDTAQRFLPQLLAGEDIQHPQLGVSMEELDEVAAQQLGSPETRGLYVVGVTPGSAAERAGILVGDVIQSVNGEPTETFVSLARAVDHAQVGDEVAITLSRGGEDVAVTATLQPWDVN